jgi:uncharacterized membrane protein
LPVTIILLKNSIIGQIAIGIYAVFVIILPFFILPKYVAKAILKITSEGDFFHLDWIKPFLGSKTKQPLAFGLDELKSYKYETSYNFSTLKIQLKSGLKLKLHRWHNDNSDDFNLFMTYFRRTIENYNKKNSTLTIIEKEKTIMENRSFLIAIGLLIVAIFITTIVLLFFKGVSNIKGIIPVLIVLGPLIWVVIRIIKGLQKAKIE